jgi:NAD-dependent dihydropyrimidine dehydrogenase PreA subunit
LVAVCSSNKCKVCHTCETNCPDLALYVEEDDKAKG